MPTRDPFPDIQDVLVDVITATAFSDADGTLSADTQTPSDFTDLLPFARIHRYGGPDDGITDRAAVTVDIFGSTYALTRAMAAKVHQLLTAGPMQTDTAVLEKARTISGPGEVPWNDSNKPRRFTASYRVAARR